jgi:type I restriction enzyme M protein
VLTGEIRGQVDRSWDAFWSGSISDPFQVMEQITYLLFLNLDPPIDLGVWV